MPNFFLFVLFAPGTAFWLHTFVKTCHWLTMAITKKAQMNFFCQVMLRFCLTTLACKHQALLLLGAQYYGMQARGTFLLLGAQYPETCHAQTYADLAEVHNSPVWPQVPWAMWTKKKKTKTSFAHSINDIIKTPFTMVLCVLQ